LVLFQGIATRPHRLHEFVNAADRLTPEISH
jgi:hypothetical protein